jgi:hypothetical protein
MGFQCISQMEGEKVLFSLSLFTNSNQTRTLFKACTEWQVWNCCKIPGMEAEVQPHRHFVLQVKCPSLLPEATKPTTLSDLLRVAGTVFLENLLHGSHDTAEKVLQSPNSLPFDVKRLQKKLTLFYCRCRGCKVKSLK